MAEPFIGEVRILGSNFAPAGWAFCDGQLLPIAEYDALFTLIGTTYGGDGHTTFALPDLRGRLPVDAGQGPTLSARTVGESGGAETVTLTAPTTPQHTHVPQATTSAATTASPGTAIWAAASSGAVYAAAVPTAPMRGDLIESAGGSRPHDNLMPFLCVSFVIALYGIYPSQG